MRNLEIGAIATFEITTDPRSKELLAFFLNFFLGGFNALGIITSFYVLSRISQSPA